MSSTMSPLLHPLLVKNRLFQPTQLSPIKFNTRIIINIIISVMSVLGIIFFLKTKYQEQRDKMIDQHKLIYKYG